VWYACNGVAVRAASRAPLNMALGAFCHKLKGEQDERRTKKIRANHGTRTRTSG
jgi:hypothetical protein